jgi:hypothetical protein
MNERHVRLIALALALAACLACDARPPLADTQGSADGLGVVVLEALAQGDRGRLEALALNEQEFRDHVWPELPAARPERNLPFSYVWGDLNQKSRLALAQALDERGGKHHALKRVRFEGDTTDYGSFRVHRKATFEVVDASGAALSLRVSGSFIEKDGRWKVFSYVTDGG